MPENSNKILIHDLIKPLSSIEKLRISRYALTEIFVAGIEFPLDLELDHIRQALQQLNWAINNYDESTKKRPSRRKV